MDHASIYFILACLFGFLMAWGVGANDVANAMGTSVGSRALTVGQAILIAMIFEFLGAYLAGGHVTSTIHKGILYLPDFYNQGEIIILGMLASLLAAGLWLIIATLFGWPVSTTHTIIGAIVGFGLVNLGPSAVQWQKIFYITISWILSPFIGGILAYGLFMSMQKFIFNTADPLKAAKKITPIYIFIASWVVIMVTLLQGLKHLGWHLGFLSGAAIGSGLSALITLSGYLLLRRVKSDHVADLRFHFASLEKIFAILMVFTACAMAFAHGSNDVANAIGPLSAVIGILHHNGHVQFIHNVPSWTLFLGGIGIITGLITLGHRVIATVGQKITELTPSRGFAATLATATTVVVASGTGLPISTTHTLVGAILGVGMARGIAALNLKVIRNILLSWIITLPVGALLAIICFKVMQKLILS